MTTHERYGRPVLVGDAFPASARNRRPAYSREDGDRIAPLTFDLSADETAQFHRERSERYHVNNTPDLFVDAIVDRPDVRAWALNYLDNPARSPWLLFLGDVGTGKTHAAYGALRYMAMSGRPTIAWKSTTAAAMYARLRPGAEVEFEVEFATWATCPLLLLDDLGATRRSDFIEEVTYRLVDERATNNKTMIITSNLLPEEFAERFGKRTASRLRQACQIIDMGLTDRRQGPEVDR